jgi:hypothetical protein
MCALPMLVHVFSSRESEYLGEYIIQIICRNVEIFKK